MQSDQTIRELERSIGYTFLRKDLLRQSLTHSSLKSLQENNEVLEFLGDAVLGFYLCHRLVEEFPYLNEGDLSKLKAILSSRKHLFEISRTISLGDLLFLGKGEKQDRGGEKMNITSSAFEAVIAAVFLDGGLPKVELFLDRFFDPFFEQLREKRIKINDYKSEAQELFQKVWGMAPIYLVDEEHGPDHDKLFTVVMVGPNNNKLVEGRGRTKKDAEQTAAKLYIQQLFPDKNRMDFDAFFIEFSEKE